MHHSLWAFWKSWLKGFFYSLQFSTNKPGSPAKCYALCRTTCEVRAEPKKERQRPTDCKLPAIQQCRLCITGAQILTMHLKMDACSVIVLPSGNSNLLNHKIFRPPRSTVPRVEMTTEAVFILSKFDIHLACLNPKLVAFWRGKGQLNEFHSCSLNPEGAGLLFSLSPFLQLSQAKPLQAGATTGIGSLRDWFSDPGHLSRAVCESGENPAWLQHCQGIGATQQAA